MGGVGVRCGLLCRLSSRSQSICKCLWLSRFNIHRKNRLLLVITFAWLAQWKVLKAYSSNTWDSCNVRRIVCLVLSFLHVGFFPTNRWGHIIRWWCSHLDNTARSAGMRHAELEVLVQWYLSYDPYDLWFSWIQKTATVVWQCVAVLWDDPSFQSKSRTPRADRLKNLELQNIFLLTVISVISSTLHLK